MSVNAIDLRSVRRDQRRITAMLGASGQVNVPKLPTMNYSGISLNNLFKSGYYRKFEKSQKDNIGNRRTLQIESSHLRSFYDLQQDIEESVSRKIKTIRKRAEDLEAEPSFDKDVTSKRLARKIKKDKQRKINVSKSNIIRSTKESYENSTTHRSGETLKWKESQDDTATTPYDESNDTIKIEVHPSRSHQSYQGNAKKRNYESGKQIPYRLPKLQIPKHIAEESSKTDFMKSPRSGEVGAPSAELHHITLEERLQLPSSPTESEQDETRQLQHLEESAMCISDASQRRFARGSNKSTRKRPKMDEIKPSSSGRVSRDQVVTVGDGVDEPGSLERETTVENSRNVTDWSTLETHASDQEKDSDEMSNISDSDSFIGNTLEVSQPDMPKTIKLRPRPIPRAKWDPNSRSDVMRRKLDNLMRRRRMARLDKIRLGGVQGPGDLPDYTTTGNSNKPMEMESYEYLPELNKKGKIGKASKRRRKATLKSTTKSFSFSYFP